MSDTRKLPFKTLLNPSPRVKVRFLQPSLTVQSFKDDTDVNVLMSHYMKTGILPNSNSVPQFGDVSDGEDYHSSLNKVIAAQDAFASLPSKIRDRFDNDPKSLLDFLDNPKNREEAVELGLLKSKVKKSLAAKSSTTSETKSKKSKVKVPAESPSTNDT